MWVRSGWKGDLPWRMRDAGYRMRDVGYWMQDAGCGMRDTGYGMQDAGHRIEDTVISCILDRREAPSSRIGAKRHRRRGISYF